MDNWLIFKALNILKPLNRPLADGDEIYACVRATAANQDGYLPEGFTVPNVFSQVALLKSVYAKAGIDPATVDFVEAHGPGTPVGDPIETTALGSVLGCVKRFIAFRLAKTEQLFCGRQVLLVVLQGRCVDVEHHLLLD